MESWNEIEALILVWIQENIRTEVLSSIMIFLSWLNNSGMLAILTVVALLLFRKYRHVGVTALSSLFVEFVLINILLKNMVQRARPYVVNETIILLGDRPGDCSFPSGHTGSAFAVAVVIFLCMPRRFGVPAIAVASLIALSRIYNGAHYPTDVLGAVMIAVLTGVMAWNMIFPVASKHLQKVRDTDKE